MLPTPALQDLRDVPGRQHWGVDPRPMTGASPPHLLHTTQDILEVLEGCWQLHAGAAEEGVPGSALQEASFVLQV